MNRRKVRKLLDSVAAQLTAETDALIVTLNEIKKEHEAKMDKALTAERTEAAGWHVQIVRKINYAIRQVQS
jgi:hypothetical protein